MRTLKVGSIFTGIGAWEKALLDLDVDFDLKFFCEFDKYAVQSYCAMYGESKDKNLGDITKVNVEEVPDVDVIFYSPPCQAFSVAGKQEGFDDRRGVLFFDALKVIEAKRPRLCIMENVKGLIGTKFTEEFCEMLYKLEDLGYINSWKVLNAKDYGIPQNRERVFVVSLLSGKEFEFPEPIELKLRLKDMLEDEVDEKFYVSEEKTKAFFENNPEMIRKLENKNISNAIRTGGRGSFDRHQWDMILESNIGEIKKVGQISSKGSQAGMVYSCEGNSPTICAGTHGYAIGNIVEPNVEQIGNIRQSKTRENPQAGRVYDQEGISPTLNTMQGGCRQPHVIEPRCGAIRGRYKIDGVRQDHKMKVAGLSTQQLELRDDYITNTITTVQKDNMVLDNFRIRRLTPTECWRLQGFKDEDIQKCIDAKISNTQLYKMAGNSICVNVPKAILKKLFNL